MTDNETALIAAARRDPAQFGRLYLLYVERVYRYLYGRTGCVQEAEDLTAQTFLAAFEAFDTFRQDGHFAAWLFTIARNKTMDYYRSHRATMPIDAVENLFVASGAPDPLQVAIQSEQAGWLAALIRELPEDDRELLRLRFLADMSFPEIARCLNRKEDAVKKSIYRLLARLQGQMEVTHG